MGVQGLWKLLESTGKPVSLEAMSHKTLAIDISIWLNQIVKAMRDADGNRLPNSHIIAVYHRLCKLLFYNVKPIVVFDGSVPELKRQTCAKRRALKTSAADAASAQKREKLKLSLKQLAVAHVSGEKVESKKVEKPTEPDMFYLPPTEKNGISRDMAHDDEDDDGIFLSSTRYGTRIDPRNRADPFSDEFRALPPDIQHELLLQQIDENKERAKASSCTGKPDSDNFSQQQIENLVAKSNLTKRLKEVRVALNSQNNDIKLDGHSVRVFNTSADSEIVFTKQINNEKFDIVNTRQVAAPQDKEKKMKKEEIAEIKDEDCKKVSEISKSDEMKNIFFGSSDSDNAESDEEVKVEKMEEDDNIVVQNVFGLAQGHPGTFLNPYALHKPTTVRPVPSIKMAQSEDYLVPSSSESDLEDVPEPVTNPSDNRRSPSEVILIKEVSDENPPIPDELTKIAQEDETLVISQKTAETVVSNVVPDAPSEVPTEIQSSNIVPDNQTIEAANELKVNKETLLETKTVPASDDLPLAPHHVTVVDEPPMTNGPSLEKEDFQLMSESIESELQVMRNEQRKNLSVSDSVNKGLITDVKELLSAFGVPYLVAPGEAEAQCATLCSLGLCDGVITDDSDIFLFGDVCVFKDVFKRDRDTRQFTSQWIEESLGLSRAELIDMAQLVGSDYCTGVRGVGCVLALEIISKHKNLSNFKNQAELENRYTKFDFSGIPSESATNAYLNPDINSSQEPFTWSVPDAALIKDFLFKKLAWSGEKVDETLKPVMSAVNDKTRQKSIQSYFLKSQATSPSKRVQTAVKKIKTVGSQIDKTARGGKRKRKGKQRQKKKVKYVESENEESD